MAILVNSRYLQTIYYKILIHDPDRSRWLSIYVCTYTITQPEICLEIRTLFNKLKYYYIMNDIIIFLQFNLVVKNLWFDGGVETPKTSP